ncbi:2-(1,2-epoxy-1,2-dihydrophenyl)acetyl-CoA isomerase [Dyadobacter jejuensis]|uniref:2-(1,2-epoxy-1,2-dihydrophenyl)acetyl-CoA isomerase n=1 Tax=Dyadobacter jejuensis TaxID=1082580 RepID=A0A316AJR6_9BACT|nr:enoyl-CoA hydratase-related protein [Dyadobacter jejuensis]PWJ57588.1 2-(1,2-epoxy-1,2-dihydrophenyl)acetyl-CoA isomerase [Dyadobacter jejuensis]
MFQYLKFQNHGGIVRISLNRPEVFHALNKVLIAEITQAIGLAQADEQVRVVLLTAEGDTAFCSGADLKDAFLSKLNVDHTLRDYYNPMIMAIRNIPKPVVCRLNGLAVGAGASLALSCDLVIASEQAYLSQMFVQIGLMPDAGASFILPRLVGAARAFELASTGRKVPASEAQQMGMIAQCVSAELLDSTVERQLQYYLHAPTQAIGAMKLVMNQSLSSDLPQMLDLERHYQQKLSETADFKEGLNSFLQKKKPDYQGK